MAFLVNPGNGAFKSKIGFDSPDSDYVDKSMLISYINSVLNTANKEIVFSRPRRFGKTTDALMLAAYYSVGCDSRELFDHFAVSKDPSYLKHLNKYHLLYIDMTDYVDEELITSGKSLHKLKMDVFTALANEFQDIVQDIIQVYGKDNLSVRDAISVVAEKTKRKFVIIIDEWDLLIREAESNPKLKNEYIQLLRKLFKTADTQSFLAGAYMTGILPIVRYNTQSALTDFREFSMVKPKELAPFFGLTEEDMIPICRKYHASLEMLRKWYDGYHLTRYNVRLNKMETFHIYCPLSVLLAASQHDYDTHWNQTSAAESLKTYIDMNISGVGEAVTRLLGGEKLKIDPSMFDNDIHKILSFDDVMTLLVHLGYLSYDPEEKTVSIPNFEMRQFFISSMKESRFDDLRTAVKKSEELLDATIAMNESKVAELIDEVHNSRLAHLKYNSEDSLRYIILLAYISSLSFYTSFQELASGKGFCDILFIPYPGVHKPALLVELKWDKPTEKAMNQIDEKNYTAKLREMHFDKDILLVGITYDSAKKTHSCRIRRA